MVSRSVKFKSNSGRGGLTSVSTHSVLLLCLHLLVNEPEGVLEIDRSQIGTILTFNNIRCDKPDVRGCIQSWVQNNQFSRNAQRVQRCWRGTDLHRKQDIDQQVTSTTNHEESRSRREYNSDEDENNV